MSDLDQRILAAPHWMEDGRVMCRLPAVTQDERNEIVTALRDVVQLRERLGPRGLEVVMIDGSGHYVNEKVKAEIDLLREQLVNVKKELAEALAVIEDTVGYQHSGDPWEENAFDMGELDIHDYAKDGRLQRARTALSDDNGKPSVGAQIEGVATVNSEAREPASITSAYREESK